MAGGVVMRVKRPESRQVLEPRATLSSGAGFMEGGAISQELGLQKETGLLETPEEKGRCILASQCLPRLALWEIEG